MHEVAIASDAFVGIQAESADGCELCQLATASDGFTFQDESIISQHIGLQRLGSPSKSFVPYRQSNTFVSIDTCDLLHPL